MEQLERPGLPGGQLVGVQYQNPQAAADKMVPIGWCNQCIGEAKLAENGGKPMTERIHAGVTLVPMLQQVQVPGMGTVPSVLALPVCWKHLTANPASGLLTA